MITGAAAIMAAVFASFAIAPVATVSQMGLGLTVAILLDATVVRIVLLAGPDAPDRRPGLAHSRLARSPPAPSRSGRPVPRAAEAAS